MLIIFILYVVKFIPYGYKIIFSRMFSFSLLCSFHCLCVQVFGFVSARNPMLGSGLAAELFIQQSVLHFQMDRRWGNDGLLSLGSLGDQDFTLCCWYNVERWLGPESFSHTLSRIHNDNFVLDWQNHWVQKSLGPSVAIAVEWGTARGGNHVESE